MFLSLSSRLNVLKKRHIESVGYAKTPFWQFQVSQNGSDE